MRQDKQHLVKMEEFDGAIDTAVAKSESVTFSGYWDRSEWPKGPWDDEPDGEIFTAHGLACILRRSPSLAVWCGYVRLPAYHKPGIEDELQCHHGITFTESGPDGTWVGFDCGHCDDHGPTSFHQTMMEGLSDGSEYRTLAYAREQVISLVEQIILLTPPETAFTRKCWMKWQAWVRGLFP